MEKSNELKRLEADMNANEALREKLDAETKRIAQEGGAANDAEVMVRAAASLGYEITVGELERALAQIQELDADDMALVAGGIDGSGVDEYGHDGWCLTAWHCTVVTLHTESKSWRAACLKDYQCAWVYIVVSVRPI